MHLKTSLIGHHEFTESITHETRKERHLLLTGPVRIRKSAVLEAVIDQLLLRQNKTVIPIHEYQAKGQFVELESGLLKSSTLELDVDLDFIEPSALEWTKIKRSVNRLSIRDLTAGTKKPNVAKLWWKMTEIEISPLSSDQGA